MDSKKDELCPLNVETANEHGEGKRLIYETKILRRNRQKYHEVCWIGKNLTKLIFMVFFHRKEKENFLWCLMFTFYVSLVYLNIS